MRAPPLIIELVDRFSRNLDAYRSGQYNETQVRREFIDPFFECLGWDIDNDQGYAEAYKDVIHEDAIKIGGDTKAPDYCFRIGGARKFFVEAKKPSVNIERRSPSRPSSCGATPGRPSCRCRSSPTSRSSPSTTAASSPRRPTRPRRPAFMLPHVTTSTPSGGTRSPAVFSTEAVLKGSFDKFAEPARRARRARPRSMRRSWRRSKAGARCWPATSPCATRPRRSAS